MTLSIWMALSRRSLVLATLVSISTGFKDHRSSSVRPTVFTGRRSLLPTTTTMMQDVECDVVIVGGGPAGCTCALYTSRAGLKTVIVDKNPSVGALAITSHIANFPGVDQSMSGGALLEEMRNQAINEGTDYRRAQVFMVEAAADEHMKYVYTPQARFCAPTLVLATGAMGRAASIEGEDAFLGRGVSYCATCDAPFYRDAEVAVLGVTAEAVEEAEFLARFASTVHWITPQEMKRDDSHIRALLAAPNVRQWQRSNVVGIEGDDVGVTGVRVKARGGGASEEVLPVEGVFIYTGGSKPITDFVDQKEVRFKEDGGVWVDGEMCTNVAGVYAIGDIRNTPFKQVVVAASEGCIAAMSIGRYLAGRKSFKLDWVHH